MLTLKDLHVSTDHHEIIKGVTLHVKAGEVHAIMGPNGSGKSTLAKAIAGHPEYMITKGSLKYEMNFKDIDLTKLNPDERAKEGIFLAFQYPTEIPGVPNRMFLQKAFDEVCKHHGSPKVSDEDFAKILKEKMKLLNINDAFLDRPVNTAFSGGEKKRNEILQMALLTPRLALLDETDSGLDIDALKEVAGGVNQLKNKNNAIVVVTHYQRLLNYIVPDFVHVLMNGKIVKSGDAALAKELEAKGYDWLTEAT